ncbi:MAG: endonuclease/exonuclease/phosphatase family protein [Cyclonatronaceae bacterium]
MKTTVRISILLIILVAGFFILFNWAGDSVDGPGTQDGVIYSSNGYPADIPEPDTLRIMTWNIAYGYGMGSDGVGYAPKNPEEFEERLHKMAELIRDKQIDIVLIQEIDFHAARSHKVNQLEVLSRLTGLAFGAPAVSWDAGYVPFPYWPPDYQFGRTKSGGAILSRFPIVDNEVILHPKPDANPWYYNAFYLFRYSQVVTVLAGESRFRVVNNHLEAYDNDNRSKQASVLASVINSDSETDAPVIVFGGDMNTVPEQASRLTNFDDDYNDDYRDDSTMSVLNSIPGFREIIADSLYATCENRFHTFPSTMPNRRLDYLFISNTMQLLEYEFISTGNLSDHLPVIATITWKQ